MKIKYCILILLLTCIEVYGQNKITLITTEKNALNLFADTSEKTKFIEDLSIFLAYIDYGATNNPRVVKDVLKENEEPYFWLIGIEKLYKNDGFLLKPRLLAVIPRKDKYFVKIAYDGVSQDGSDYKLGTIVTLVAQRKPDHFYFLDFFRENIIGWNKKKLEISSSSTMIKSISVKHGLLQKLIKCFLVNSE